MGDGWGPGELPARSARFFGREREVAELCRLAGRERLLSVVGAPGGGKTRLALEVGAQVAPRFTGGVRFVDLAPVGDPETVAAAVGVALGVPEERGRPLRDVLVEALRRAEPVLVLLDNCEHVIDAAAGVAGDIVAECPPVSFLATSRAPLGASDERLWTVPPLDPAAAAALFVDRAQSVAGGPTLDRFARRPSRRSAPNWTSCRWRSSSPRRGPGCSRRDRSSTG
jgi:predicted ATPase